LYNSETNKATQTTSTFVAWYLTRHLWHRQTAGMGICKKKMSLKSISKTVIPKKSAKYDNFLRILPGNINSITEQIHLERFM
jgi:hypothetical protein